ncbi:MAG: molybdenum cofactor biosynthesis protein MoaE [Dehalococcoidia bacterium]|nr:molybdenum cofactor biosynthesis protein MoaE [Dehalococcoidia bacterium]
MEDEVFEITDKEVIAGDLEKVVLSNDDGAVVTFAGVVRGFSKGKKVLYLEYEAYKEMAEKKMAVIGDEIKARWPVDGVAIRHRIGHLEIGDTAVAIAVSSAHRREAFEACQYAIDRIKQFVPVWKKEVWEDGDVWVGREGG